MAQRGHPEQVSSRQHSISSPHTPCTDVCMDLCRHQHTRSRLNMPPAAGSAAASDIQDELLVDHGGWEWKAPVKSQLLLHEALPWQPDHTWHGCTFL